MKKTFEVRTEEGETVVVAPIGNDGSPLTNVVGYRFWGAAQVDVLKQIVEWVERYGNPHIYHLYLGEYSSGANNYIGIVYRQENWGLPLADDYELVETA